MIKSFYWCPYISEVATVRSVINSTKSLKKYSNEKIKPYIINVVGEWNNKKEYLEDFGINFVELKNKNLINKLPKLGFIKSRFTYLIILLFSIRKLHNLLRKEKPDFLIVHLISVIPLILLIFFNYNTKFVLRISGYPKLNFFRKFLWKLASKKLKYITCPTILTINLLKDKKIFDFNKLKYLPDPILEIKEVNKQKKMLENIDNHFSKKNTLLSIGRLTEQKNFNFLLEGFKKISEIYKDLNLVILGEGEQRRDLEKKINLLNLKGKVFLPGYKKNVFKYLENCKFFVLSSRYEDPGFVLIEAGIMNKIIISSDCPNGPIEIIDKNKNGYLFKNNSIDDFTKTFKEAYEEDNKILFEKKKNLKIKCKEFTLFNHYQKFKKILKNEN
jgi:glycosyltransferase involved in cell wall biosynthesis